MKKKGKVLTMAQALLHPTCFLLPHVMPLSLIFVSYSLVQWFKPQAYTVSRPQDLCTRCPLCLECFMVSCCMLCYLLVLTSILPLRVAHTFSSIRP